MQIDIVSDTVCPWCFIGKRKLERALAMRPEIPFDVRWRAYRLDPDVPRGGVDRRAYMKAKFGDSPRTSAMSDAIKAAGESVDIAFAFDRIEKRPDTIDSHRLIRWAASGGRQNDVVERLFKAYFEEGRDIGDPAVLVDMAGEAGMDAGLVEELLAKDADRELVEQEDALAHRMGISGVPTFIFANKYLISGAYDADKLVRVIDKTQSEMQTA
ncbi:MAG TPA: DsbA family oxidoreductase [Rhizomicrobium sp.]|nr:DsbA family oxidoreductase [Rhizomicrobium sp.]